MIRWIILAMQPACREALVNSEVCRDRELSDCRAGNRIYTIRAFFVYIMEEKYITMKKYFVLPFIAGCRFLCHTGALPECDTTRAGDHRPGDKDRRDYRQVEPTDKTKTIEMIDQLLTLEGDELDSIGTLEAIKGVTQELKENDRFNEVKLLDTP